tara:strand:- start:478 stop:1608 length:1131 start_codon:yes stop_codon:yes gene_type:complete
MEKTYDQFRLFYNEVRDKNIKDQVSNLKLELFMRLLQNVKETKPFWRFIVFVNTYFNTTDYQIKNGYKIFLSTYTIFGYPDEILSSSRNELEEEVYQKSKQIIDSFDLLDKCSKTNYETVLTDWFNEFLNFSTLFSSWKNADLETQIEVYTKSYYELEVMLHNMDDTETKKDIWEVKIRELQNKLRSFIRSLAGDKGLHYLDNYKYKLVLVDNMELRKKIEATVHKAYWEKCKEELSGENPNFSFLVKLLKEIVNTVSTRIIPNRKDIHKQFTEVIDIQFIEHQIEHGVLDFDKIIIYAKFIVNNLKKWGSAMQENELDKWFKELLFQLEPPKIENFNLATFLTELFRGIMENLESIANETERIRAIINNKQAKEV